MKRLLAVFVMLALPAAAQQNRPASGAGGGNASGAKAGAGSNGGGGAARSGGGNAGPSSGGSGGGAVSRGGSGGGSVSSGGARASGGGQHTASGGSGVAVSRNPDRGSNTNAGRHGDAGAINSGGATASGSGVTAAPRAAGTAADSSRNARTGDGNATGVPAYARPRTDQPVIGTAVPRGSVPPATGGIGGAIGPTGGVGYYYPWWWFGGAGLYGSYWGYNYYGYPGYFGAGAYSGYSDPWFGGYPDAQDMPSGSAGGGWSDEGALKLKIKPRTAEVFVDGFYVGVVDDFDGMFQKLHIESGAHRIEVRAEGYEPLVFDVRITTDHATTYQGELKRIK
jgi:hypothetical protein